eukprot:jgi/Chrzof1/6828/Cz02g00050.t1
MGMCSKCYRQQQQEQEKVKAAEDAFRAAATPQPALPAPKAVEEPPATPTNPEPSASAPSVSNTTIASTPEAASKGPSRCQQCRKKVGLTGFKCKCGLMFCGQHRYAETHDCTFDYKAMERQKLAENNPLVQASKVARF